jgi:hypothetical protein
MKRLFEFLSDVLNGAEKSVLDFMSAVVPYAVPVIPAYLTYFHTQNMMGFPAWVAGTAAFVVEALGMASVSTAIRFWHNNQRYKSEANKAPFWLAFSVYVFYVVIILVVNVILENVAGTRNGLVILCIGLFSMLSIPSGVLIAIRSQYREMLEDRTAKKTGGKQQAEPAKQSYKEKHASDFKDRIPQMLNEEWEKNKRILTPKEITAKLKLDHGKNKGYVSTITSQWKAGNSDKFTF